MHGQGLTFVALLLCMLVIVLATCSCARTLKSCAASIIIFGPVTVTMTCPPAGFQQRDEGADTTEQPTR